MRDDSNKRIHHSLKGKERKDYRNTTEDWENAIVSVKCHGYSFNKNLIKHNSNKKLNLIRFFKLIFFICNNIHIS